MKRPVQISAIALLVVAATACAQVSATTSVPGLVPSTNPLVEWGLKALWTLIGGSVATAIVVYTQKGFASLKAWGDTKIKNDNWRVAWDHFNDAIANAVIHVEVAERPQIINLPGMFENGKLSDAGKKATAAAALKSLQADASATLATITEAQGLAGQAATDFVLRAINAEVARQKAA